MQSSRFSILHFPFDFQDVHWGEIWIDSLQDAVVTSILILSQQRFLHLTYATHLAILSKVLLCLLVLMILITFLTWIVFVCSRWTFLGFPISISTIVLSILVEDSAGWRYMVTFPQCPVLSNCQGPTPAGKRKFNIFSDLLNNSPIMPLHGRDILPILCHLANKRHAKGNSVKFGASRKETAMSLTTWNTWQSKLAEPDFIKWIDVASKSLIEHSISSIALKLSIELSSPLTFTKKRLLTWWVLLIWTVQVWGRFCPYFERDLVLHF